MASVVMGVRYQREDLRPLERAVESILSQNFYDFELLICESNSTEAAKARLERFEEEDGRVILVDGVGTNALGGKLNRCIAQAKGIYIARMDDDDYSHPDRFEKQFAFLEEHPGIAFVGCNVNLRLNEFIIGVRRLPEQPTVRDFYMTQPFIHPALLFRREALEIIGGYSEDERCILCEDYDLLLRLYARGYRGVNLQETLFDYTIPTNAKGTRKMSHRWNETVTRWRRFRELGVLPEALPYVIKPLAVGLIPECLLAKVKASRIENTEQSGYNEKKH